MPAPLLISALAFARQLRSDQSVAPAPLEEGEGEGEGEGEDVKVTREEVRQQIKQTEEEGINARGADRDFFAAMRLPPAEWGS